jgi:hypothetical protein
MGGNGLNFVNEGTQQGRAVLISLDLFDMERATFLGEFCCAWFITQEDNLAFIVQSRPAPNGIPLDQADMTLECPRGREDCNHVNVLAWPETLYVDTSPLPNLCA